MPVLRAAALSGSGALSAETFPQDQPVDLILEGSGNLVFSGDVPTLTARLDGLGDLWLHGITGAADLTLEGLGNLKAQDMSATFGDISLDGSGDLSATVTGLMRIALSGSGDIDSFGGGSLEASAIDGSGDLGGPSLRRETVARIGSSNRGNIGRMVTPESMRGSVLFVLLGIAIAVNGCGGSSSGGGTGGAGDGAVGGQAGLGGPGRWYGRHGRRSGLQRRDRAGHWRHLQRHRGRRRRA